MFAFRTAQDPVSCATHAFGAVLSLLGGFVFLLRGIADKTGPTQLSSAMCFCLSLIALYSASAIYHYYPGTASSGGIKRLLRKLDHSMIYVLIAGSYTPFALTVLPGQKGYTFCAILWGIALVGILIKLCWLSAPRILCTAAYLAMGWAVVFAWSDFAAAAPGCLWLLLAGGICYSVGAVFYALKWPNFNSEFTFHELFHLFILAGSACHYLAVFWFVL